MAILFGVSACSDSNKDSQLPNEGKGNVTIKLELPEEYKTLVLNTANLNGEEKNSNKKVEKTIDKLEHNTIITDLKPGLYNLDVVAKGEQAGKTIELKGYIKDLTVNGLTATSVKLNTITVDANFVIEEIYYTGTRYPNSKKVFIGNQYFKITNNSDEVLYADGLTIAESTFSTTQKFEYTPNRMPTDVAVQALYQVPGEGKTYPVEPGKSIIICDKANDHITEAGIPESFDLSKADFEWFDESQVPNFQDSDNPDVPNLNKIYSYTRSVWILNQQGNKAYLLLRMGKETDKFLVENELNYSYYQPAADKTINSKSYFVPNSWVIDAVNISSTDKYQWNVTDLTLDAGYTYCGENSKDPERNGKSVRRKVAYTNDQGRAVLQKTNNSSDDFIPNSIPSLKK